MPLPLLVRCLPAVSYTHLRKLHVHDLMVDHVIIALEDTFAILRMTKRKFHIRVGGVDLAGGRRAEPHAVLVVQIQLDGVTGRFPRAGSRQCSAPARLPARFRGGST